MRMNLGLKKLIILAFLLLFLVTTSIATELTFPIDTFENITVNQNIILGGQILLEVDQLINASILPTEDDKFDIGSSSFRWQNAFFSDVVTAGYFTGNGSQLTNLNVTLDQAYDSESGEHLVTIDNGELVFDVTGNDNITIRFDDFDVLVFDPLEYEMRVAKGSGLFVNFLDASFRIPSVNSLPKSLGDLSGFNTSNFILVNSQNSIQVNINGTKDGWRRLDNNNSGVFGATTFVGDGSLLTGISPGTSVWNSSGSNVFLNDSTATVLLESAVTINGNLLVDDQAGGNELGPLLHAAAVAATPAYSFGWDTNTGMTSLSGDKVSFIAGGINIAEFKKSPVALDMKDGGSTASPNIIFEGDVDTGIWHPTINVLAFSAGGVEFIRLDKTDQEYVFNENSITNINFRIESNNNQNMFYVDGTNDMVGIGTITPTSTLTVIGNASFTRNISAANVCNPAHFFFHTNDTIPVILGVWRNITFAQDPNGLVAGISHDPVGRLNYSINITGKGVYKFQYYAVFTDSSASPTANIAIRIIKNGIEINGSTFEIDATRQNAEVEISNTIHVQIEAGDSIAFQFIADDLDVSLETHSTFGQHPDSATMTMARLTCI